MATPNSVEEKVEQIFRELVGDRVKNLDSSSFSSAVASTITAALCDEDSDKEILTKDEIAFHLTDWNGDAAFIVALLLFPERFSKEEIQDGVESCLIHIPQHILAAARLGGYPAEDIFKESDSEV